MGAALDAGRGGVGIGILHAGAARHYPELRVVLPEISFTRTYWIVTHAEVRNLHRIAEVHAFMLERVKANRSLFM